MQDFIRSMEIFKAIDSKMMDDLLQFLQRVEVKKGSYLLKKNDSMNKIYIIEKGLIASYGILRGQKMFTSFRKEEEIIIYHNSLFYECRSDQFYVAIEDSVIYTLDRTLVARLVVEYRAMGTIFYGLILKSSNLLLQDHINMLRVIDRTQRYRKFIETNADIAKRIPTKYIASFLDTSFEYLIRIKKALARKLK